MQTIHKLRPKRRVLRSGPVVATLAAAAIGQLGLVISGVIAARILGVTDRGQLALIVLLPAVVSQVIALGVPLAVTYQTAARSASVGHVLGELKTTLMRQAFAALIVSALVLWVFFKDESEDLQIAAAISVISTLGMLALMYGLAILQGQQRFLAFNFWRTAPSAAAAVGAFALLAAGSENVSAFAAVWTIATLAAAIGTLLSVRRGRDPGANRSQEARALRRFGAKAFFGADSLLESFRIDQLIVGILLAPAALGLYVTAVAVTNLPRFVAQSIGMVAYPSIAGSKTTQREAIRAALRWAAISGGFTLLIVIALEVLGDDLIGLLFGDEFLDAVDPLQILLVGALLLGLRRVLGDGLRGANMPGASSIGELTSWLVFLPSGILLASSDGVEGVAVALVISAFVSLAAVLLMTARALREYQDRPTVAPGPDPSRASIPVE